MTRWVICLAIALPALAQSSVPFVGCKSDGQIGPQDAPEGKPVAVKMSPKAAESLAYYSAGGIGVLAPLGWYCFGVYGSGGESLFVIPQSFDDTNILNAFRPGFAGPAIELAFHGGETADRNIVAEVIARVFPAKKKFVDGVKELFDGLTFPSGPYPKDKLRYRSQSVVEYRTPPHTEGLGTHSALRMNDSPIDGAAVITKRFNLYQLSVRLPANQSALTPAIVNHFEREPKDVR